MSVVSKNPFDLLGDDGSESPSPAVTKPAAPAKKAEAPAPAKTVPGAAQRGGAADRGRGARYPSRGAPRNVYRESEPRNNGPTSADGVAEGMETPGGFDGERIPNPRKGAHVRDAHTKGPRGNRPARNLTSGGHSSRGRGHVQGSNVPASGGERRQFERRSGGLPDSQKKIDQGWGANESAAELTAEVEGEKDAVAEENAPGTPAPEGEDGGWGTGDAPVEAADAAAEPEVAAEPEEVQKSLEDYLAERAASGLAGIGKKEGRQVNSETLEGTAFRREAIDDFFSGKEKTVNKGNKAPKKEKVYIEFDGQFASPAGSRPPRGDGADRGARGGRGGRGRGGPRGGAGARGGARGGASRGRGGAAGGAPINPTDESAFPALGA